MITEEKEALSPELRKFAEKYCRSALHPMMIVDNLLSVVYSSHPKLVPVDTLLSMFVKDFVETPLKREKDVILIFKEVTYCARFTPIDKNYSFCELLDYSSILTLASFTDLYSVMSQRFWLLEECTANIEKYVQMLSDNLSGKARIKNMHILDLQAESKKLDFLLTGIIDYTFMSFSVKNFDEVIDTYALIDFIIKESNSYLEGTGKYIEFVSELDGYFIYTDQRYAIISVLNALQNALLYSPRDDVPVVSLTRSVKDDKKYVVVQVVNDLDEYTMKTSDEEPDFVHRRCGLGIPLIKKFVQRAGGEFYFKNDGKKAYVGIMIPEFILRETETFTMECSGFSLYDYGGKNIIKLMMEDVVSSLSKKR